MPRKNRYQWEREGGDFEERKSRSQKKRESSSLQAMGEELSTLPIRELELLPLPPKFIDACRELPRIKSHEARRRQLQYLGRLMREVDDTAPLEEALALFKDGLRPSAHMKRPIQEETPDEE